MKKLLILALSMISLVGYSQSTVNPDTVCYQTSGSTYTVPSLGAGYTYTWTIASPGVITSGQTTNSIVVNWSTASPGLINSGVSVVASSASGCLSTPVTLNVLIYQVLPTITPIGPFCTGAACVTLVGSPIGGTFTGTGVVGNQFCPITAGVGTFTLTYPVTSGGCTFTTTTSVTVTPTPTLSPIQHN